MSLGKIKTGEYGKYYSYFHNGKYQNLSLRDQGINLTPDELDHLIINGTLTFKDAKGNTVLAEFVSYFNKKFNKQSQYIKYTSNATSSVSAQDLAKDKAIIEQNKDKIIDIFSKNKEYWNEKWTEDLLNNKLTLSQTYFCNSSPKPFNKILKVIIYYGKSKKDTSNVLLTIYLKPTGARFSVSYYSTCEYQEISEAEYQQSLKQYEEEEKSKAEKAKKLEEAYTVYKDQVIDWFKAINKDIANNAPHKTIAEYLDVIEPYIKKIPATPNPCSWRPAFLLDIISMDKVTLAFGSHANSYVEPSYYEDKATTLLKSALNDLRKWYDYHKIRIIRDTIYKEVKDKGIEAVVDQVNIDNALDLDVFLKFRKAVKKGIKDAEEFICYNMFIDILDPDELKTHILNMLKTYHSFCNFPAKERAAMAKFIANNKLEDYYDEIAKYDEVLEVLIDESKDTKFKKKLLVGASGGVRDLSFLQKKTLYFERIATIKNVNLIVYKPLELLDQLRALLPVYNANSDVNVLTNIILEDDGGYVYKFQFYTFSDTQDGSDMDGRRLQYLARLYNSNKDDAHKIYFSYDF